MAKFRVRVEVSWMEPVHQPAEYVDVEALNADIACARAERQVRDRLFACGRQGASAKVDEEPEELTEANK